MPGTQDPSVVDPGNSTYSLRSPDSVPAADIPTSDMTRVLPRQTSTGLARGIQQLGSPNVYVDSGNEQIIVAKDSTANTSVPQVLMGNQANKGEGFYVTKTGIDVTTAKNDSDFVFNSNQDIFKIIDSLVIAGQSFTTATIPAGQYGIDVHNYVLRHTYGFAPIFSAFQQQPGQYYAIPTTAWFNASTTQTVCLVTQVYSSVDSFTVEVTTHINNSVGATGLSVSVTLAAALIYVLQESAAKQ